MTRSLDGRTPARGRGRRDFGSVRSPFVLSLPLCLSLLAVPAVGQDSAATGSAAAPTASQASLETLLARVQIRENEMAEAGGVRIPYGLYLPTSYDGSRPTPLVVALHGLGSGVMYMMEYGNLLELAEQYGYIIATPMGFNERGWYGSRGPGNEFNRSREDPGPPNLGELSERDVLNVLNLVRDEFSIDESRIYLIGQSMGGGGTWHLAIKYPEIWAAAAPLAPAIYSDPAALVAARNVPFIVVMGDADELVDVEVTRRWVAKLRELGIEHEYIEVPGGTHSSAGRENIGRVFEFLSRHRK